jgi:hypothetical protein
MSGAEASVLPCLRINSPWHRGDGGPILAAT